MTDTHVVIMAGGIGSRLWPLSTPEMPKQFIDVLGCGRTLLQMTADRFASVCRPDRFWVVTSARHVGIVREQLPDIPEAQILAEPVARSTAPCIAYACRKIAARSPEANIVVTPADALVLKTELFAAHIREALRFTENSGAIVTVGIVPTRPETGFGYILAESASLDQVVKVTGFVEKPDLPTAERYLADGRYFWNAGIYVWNVRTIEAQLRTYAPQIAGVMDELAPSLYTGREPEELQRLFPTCDKISIEYAVMEKSPDIHIIAGDFGWSDLGTWGSVKSHIAADENGNAVVGTGVRLFDTRDCIVHAAGEKTVVIQGLENCIVAEKNGRLLVCSLSKEQQIKEYSADEGI